MSEQPKKITCGKCLMTFKVKRPTERTEQSRCPQCYRAFWHGTKDNRRASVGIEPHRLPEWQS